MPKAIACDLSVMTETQRARYGSAIQYVEDEAVSAEPVPGGYALRYPTAEGSVLKLAEFITLERLCCPFLDFELRVAAGADHVELRLTGGPGVQTFLADEIDTRT